MSGYCFRKLLFATSNIEKILGYTPEEAYAFNTWLETVHSDDLSLVVGIYDQVLDSDHARCVQLSRDTTS